MAAANSEGRIVTLLYVRPRNPEKISGVKAGANDPGDPAGTAGAEQPRQPDPIEERLARLAELHGPRVELVIAEYAGDRSTGSTRQPRVMILRGGVIVGEAVGSLYPTRELDRVVGHAVAGA